LERSTGDSSNEVGLSPGGIVRQGDLEIGSFAGDISLYLALLDPPTPSLVAALFKSPPSTVAIINPDGGGTVAGEASITAFAGEFTGDDDDEDGWRRERRVDWGLGNRQRREKGRGRERESGDVRVLTSYNGSEREKRVNIERRRFRFLGTQ